MKMAPESEQPRDAAKEQRNTQNSVIRDQVLLALGKPPDLLSVQVRPLWGAKYRVNVFVGTAVTSASISHSFFLATDGDGNILEATPKIKRQY